MVEKVKSFDIKRAREKADEYPKKKKIEEFNKQMEHVNSKILTASANGDYHIKLVLKHEIDRTDFKQPSISMLPYIDLDDSVLKALKADGYEVDADLDRNEVKISW